jgi:hypothetical protein
MPVVIVVATAAFVVEVPDALHDPVETLAAARFRFIRTALFPPLGLATRPLRMPGPLVRGLVVARLAVPGRRRAVRLRRRVGNRRPAIAIRMMPMVARRFRGCGRWHGEASGESTERDV